jgi:Flp pilus assembly protein TadG
MHRLNTQSGQALLLVMIAMVPICLVLGLVVDVGMAYFTKTSARAAAQSAALAAVQAAIDGISENGWTSYQCGQGPACQSSPASCTTSLASNLQSACAYAEANGFAGGNILVDAGNGTPPGVDGVTGANYWVRVQITQQSPLTFGIFSGLQKLNVTASAVAAAANMMPLDCLVALNRSADDALSMAGNAVSRISGCGVGVDSNSSSALYVNGNTTLQAPWIRVVGTCGGNGCGAVSPLPQPAFLRFTIHWKVFRSRRYLTDVPSLSTMTQTFRAARHRRYSQASTTTELRLAPTQASHSVREHTA